MSFTAQRLRLIRSPLARPQAITRPKMTTSSRRGYASAPTPPGSRNSNTTWLVITAALGIPAAYYLLQGNSTRDQSSLGPRSGPPTGPPSSKDPPSSQKAPGDPNTMSFKQEGLDNADTKHPYANAPGKSVKGEGETETAKLKGTVSVDRPQR
ncbi:hypothetical protein BJX68DRAFT_268800 [Aspergillus pseudodeflectus]|uniref:Uncharacterized protein n=1 Tax=Aspergillus pseudodeflectus TaxID=176178 RepID=A0ABR4K217_9EURO